MNEPSERTTDRDDFQYPMTATVDQEGQSDTYSSDGEEEDNGCVPLVQPEPESNGLQRASCAHSPNEGPGEGEQCSGGHPDDGREIPSLLCKEFTDEEEAEMCYREYARSMGFGVRKHNKRRDINGNITGRTWVCSREGVRPAKHMEKRHRGSREARPVTRTGCRAQFRIIFNKDTRRWTCSYFHGVHNHQLTPAQLVHHIRSHRRVTSPDLVAASSLHKVGVTPAQIHEFMVDRSGGYDKVGYTRVDVQNRLDANRRRELRESDAQTCLSYLEGKKSSDPSFFYDLTVTSSNRLGDLFWCDGGCRADYALFGDVIAFDATYKTNAYQKPFVVILGINHHRRTIVFGFALLSDETEHTYTWLLETFMTAMNNKHPKAVITDGDRAMRNAVSKTFSEATHRLCCWHLARNAQTNVNNTEFTRDFRRCMLNAYTEDEFNSKWELMLDKHQVGTNDWVLKMYEDRHMWAEAYLRGKFFAGMRSTQRSEGMNAFLNHYVNRRLRLIDFVKQMDRLMDRQREGEGKDDFGSYDGQPVLITHLKLYEKQAGEKYTRAMFRLVRDEIDKEGTLTPVMCDRDIQSKIYRVRQLGVSGKEMKVVVNEPTKMLLCSCKLLESSGIPCSHAFAVMKAEDLEEIPGPMILSRWTKGAKILDHASVGRSSNASHYMTEQARVALIYASCRSLLRYAASSVTAYNVAINDIYNLTLRLEAMCQNHQPHMQPHQRGENAVQDPEIVLTKGSIKRSKVGQPQQRKCSRCGVAGHNVRKCKKKIRPNHSLEDCSSNCMGFFPNRNVLGRDRNDYRAFCHERQQLPYNRTICTSEGNSVVGAGMGGLSDSWLEQFPTFTDSDSSMPTLNTAAFTRHVNTIATSSCPPSNLGHI